MQWSDDAILLGVTRKMDRLTLEVLTEAHGRCHCVLSTEAERVPALLPASALRVTVVTEALGVVCRGHIASVSGGVVPSGGTDAALVVLRAMKRLLGLLLPVNEPARQVYHATRAVTGSLASHDGRWPVDYAGWELALLTTLGHASGAERCRPAFRHGEAIYFAPRSGRFVTRIEAGAFLDRMVPVPRFLMGRANATLADVRQALNLTGMLLDNAGRPAGGGTFATEREAILQAVGKLGVLPRADERADPPPAETSFRKRLLALRPLTT